MDLVPVRRALLSVSDKTGLAEFATALNKEFGEAYKKRFSPPYPARTTVGSDLHQVPGMMIEIEAVAYVGD